MAEPLKYYYSKSEVERMGRLLEKAHPSFSGKRFVTNVLDAQWDSRELKERMRHITQCIGKELKLPYPKQIEVLEKVAPEFSGIVGFVFPDFIEVFGIDDLKTSLRAMEKFTVYSTSEFAVRPFLLRYPKEVMAQMQKWSTHKNEHVRRFSSEGCRPRLPWAMAIPALKKDPAPVLPILEQLKNDPSEYVRRSVANNLNDISKDHPNLALEISSKWKNISPETDKLVRHALRGLLKKGEPKALAIMGINHKADAKVEKFKLSSGKIKRGEKMSFAFELENTDKKKHTYRVEYGIDYLKSNGKHNRKVFRMRDVILQSGEKVQLQSSQSFADMTTRKHYPGAHRIHVLINGKPLAELDFLFIEK